jgi:hypothetical protein
MGRVEGQSTTRQVRERSYDGGKRNGDIVVIDTHKAEKEILGR